MTKAKAKKPATVKRIIKPPHPGVPEKAEIIIHDADDLYKEIRIENTLEDSEGHKVKLKEHAKVDVTVEAEPEATVPQKAGSGTSGSVSVSQTGSVSQTRGNGRAGNTGGAQV